MNSSDIKDTQKKLIKNVEINVNEDINNLNEIINKTDLNQIYCVPKNRDEYIKGITCYLFTDIYVINMRCKT